MTFLSQLANTNFLHLFSLISLPPSTPLIIIFFYLASLLTLVSQVLHFLSSHLIFPIAPSLFPFNLTSLLLLPSPLFPIISMLTILNSISPSLLLIPFLIFPSFLLRLILSLIGLLQIASQSIPQKLNFFSLALLNNVPSLPHPL